MCSVNIEHYKCTLFCSNGSFEMFLKHYNTLWTLKLLQMFYVFNTQVTCLVLNITRMFIVYGLTVVLCQFSFPFFILLLLFFSSSLSSCYHRSVLQTSAHCPTCIFKSLYTYCSLYSQPPGGRFRVSRWDSGRFPGVPRDLSCPLSTALFSFCSYNLKS